MRKNLKNRVLTADEVFLLTLVCHTWTASPIQLCAFCSFFLATSCSQPFEAEPQTAAKTRVINTFKNMRNLWTSATQTYPKPCIYAVWPQKG